MYMRIGKVTNIYPTTGKIKVMYEDERSASLPLSMLTMNQEYSMPAVGDKVVTVHMANGSSKGFVLGTYYGGGMQPKANAGYRKDFGSGAYAICKGGAYSLKATKATISGSGAKVSLGSEATLTGERVVIGYAAASEDEVSGDSEPTVFVEVLEEEVNIKASTGITLEAEEITLKCSYGEITVEELMKRLERIEDQLGLPHTIE